MKKRIVSFVLVIVLFCSLLSVSAMLVLARDYTAGYTPMSQITKLTKGNYSYEYSDGRLKIKDLSGELIFDRGGYEDETRTIWEVLVGEKDCYYSQGAESTLYRFDCDAKKVKKLVTVGEPGFYFGINDTVIFFGSSMYFRAGSGAGLALAKINLKNNKVTWMKNQYGFAFYKNRIYVDEFDQNTRTVTVYSYKMSMAGKKKVKSFKINESDYYGMYQMNDHYIYYEASSDSGVAVEGKFKYR